MSNTTRAAPAAKRPSENWAAKAATHCVTVSERGSGLPNPGGYVYESDTDTVFQLLAYRRAGGNIDTHGPGRSNSCDYLARAVGSASDLTERQWDDMGDYGVMSEAIEGGAS